MPYQGGSRLSAEKASKIGHLDVINSKLVNEIIESFEKSEPDVFDSEANWIKFNNDEEPLRLIFAVDGSRQIIQSDLPPYKEVAFVKTALLRLDQVAISKLDPDAPHPMALKDIMSEAAIYHATAFPLKGIRIKETNNYDAVRKIIFDSMKDESIKGIAYETLKWLAYEKWESKKVNSPSFECPNPDCKETIPGLAYDFDEGECAKCGTHLYLTDMIGFHLEMGEDVAPESLASAYMLISETLLLFTAIRNYWEQKKFNVLERTLFLKDGPLTLRSQYSKLAIPIRKLFEYAKTNGIKIYMAGQEKTGKFKDHLDIISRRAPYPAYFLPNNEYIRKEVQNTGTRKEDYGLRTNYGNKIFVKSEKHHQIVLSIPTGEYTDSKSPEQLLGLEKILATIGKIISHKHECALVPIELANGVASLSSYPSAAILKMFADI